MDLRKRGGRSLPPLSFNELEPNPVYKMKKAKKAAEANLLDPEVLKAEFAELNRIDLADREEIEAQFAQLERNRNLLEEALAVPDADRDYDKIAGFATVIAYAANSIAEFAEDIEERRTKNEGDTE